MVRERGFASDRVGPCGISSADQIVGRERDRPSVVVEELDRGREDVREGFVDGPPLVREQHEPAVLADRGQLEAVGVAKPERVASEHASAMPEASKVRPPDTQGIEKAPRGPRPAVHGEERHAVHQLMGDEILGDQRRPIRRLAEDVGSGTFRSEGAAGGRKSLERRC